MIIEIERDVERDVEMNEISFCKIRGQISILSLSLSLSLALFFSLSLFFSIF